MAGCVGALLVLLASVASAAVPQVILTNGQQLLGTQQQSVCARCQSTTVDAFLGIPYAQPPVGELRWQMPVAPVAGAVLNATTMGLKCMQSAMGPPRAGTMSEDCLKLNVYTPPGATGSAKRLPVMVWIHGGGLVLGSTEGSGNAGWRMASETNSIVVTFHYRLGMFGFIAFANDTASSGNFGLADQVMLLQWIRSNIHLFGGDRNRVTIFGQSAGGGSVCLHIASPKSTGLFSSAIIESGFCEQASVIAYERAAYAKVTGTAVQTAAGCATVACLRSMSAETLFSAARSKYPSITYPFVDALYMPDLPLNRIRKGVFNRVRTIMGINLNEGNFAAQQYSAISDLAKWTAYASSLFGAEASAEVVAAYPVASYGSSYALVASTMFLEMSVTCSALRSIRAFADVGYPVHAYLFTKNPGYDTAKLGGAYHGAEISYVFGTVSGYTFTAAEERMHNWMVGVWTNLSTPVPVASLLNVHHDDDDDDDDDIAAPAPAAAAIDAEEAAGLKTIANWRPFTAPFYSALEFNELLQPTTYSTFTVRCAMFDRILKSQTGLDYATAAVLPITFAADTNDDDDDDDDDDDSEHHHHHHDGDDDDDE